MVYTFLRQLFIRKEVLVVVVVVGIVLTTKIIIFEDNQPAIDISENAMSSKRSRSIDIKHHWLASPLCFEWGTETNILPHEKTTR